MDSRRQGERIGFEVLTAAVMKSTIFWDITPCSSLKVNRRFGATYASVFRAKELAELETSVKEGGKQSSAEQSLYFDPEDGGDVFLRNG
jgi:hypothetical protein